LGIGKYYTFNYHYIIKAFLAILSMLAFVIGRLVLSFRKRYIEEEGTP